MNCFLLVDTSSSYECNRPTLVYTNQPSRYSTLRKSGGSAPLKKQQPDCSIKTSEQNYCLKCTTIKVPWWLHKLGQAFYKGSERVVSKIVRMWNKTLMQVLLTNIMLSPAPSWLLFEKYTACHLNNPPSHINTPSQLRLLPCNPQPNKQPPFICTPPPRDFLAGYGGSFWTTIFH